MNLWFGYRCFMRKLAGVLNQSVTAEAGTKEFLLPLSLERYCTSRHNGASPTSQYRALLHKQAHWSFSFISVQSVTSQAGTLELLPLSTERYYTSRHTGPSRSFQDTALSLRVSTVAQSPDVSYYRGVTLCFKFQYTYTYLLNAFFLRPHCTYLVFIYCWYSYIARQLKCISSACNLMCNFTELNLV